MVHTVSLRREERRFTYMCLVNTMNIIYLVVHWSCSTVYCLFVGLSCLSLNQCEEAISNLQKALQIKRTVYDGNEMALELGQSCGFLATAFFKHDKYEEAIPYLQEAIANFHANKSVDEEMECILDMARCYKHLKNLDRALEWLRKVEELCVGKSGSDKTRLNIHKQLADIFIEEEYSDRSKALHHLKEAETIAKRIKHSENDDDVELYELQARILSLEIV